MGRKGCDKSCCDGRQSDIKGDSGTGDESRGLAKEAGSTGQKSLPFAGHIKRPNWYKPGTVALREICHYQKSVEFLIIRILPFCWMVWEITQDIKSDLRFQANTLKALQKVIEYFLVHLFEDTNQGAIHTKCVTVIPKDFYLIQKLEGSTSTPCGNNYL